MNYQLVILAGGKGTRMGETDTPKVLHPLHGKPLITHLLKEMKRLSWQYPPVVVVGFKHEQVESALGEEYIYAMQEHQLGTRHAVLCAKDFVEAESIVVLYGDMPFIRAASVENLAKLRESSGSPLAIFTTTVPSFTGEYACFNGFGRILRDSVGSITAVREFKDATPEERVVAEVNPGIYAFSSTWLWDHISGIETNNVQHEYYLTDMIALAIRDGMNVPSLSIPTEEVFGINTKQELEDAHAIEV